MKSLYQPFFVALGGFALLAAACGQTLAQGYPTGPVRMIVPFPAGGGIDNMGRIVGQKLTDVLGKPIVIENRGGANGMIGSEIVAKSPKDGYTLLFNGANFVTTPSLFSKATYDPIRDFEPISLVSLAPNILVVHPSLPARSVPELIAVAKARPGQVQYAGSGSGSTPHLAAELFRTMAGLDIVHVPYKGASPALVDLIGGHIDFYFGGISGVLPHAKSGKVRVLAVTSVRRSAQLPETPTVSEAALPGYDITTWFGVMGPAGIPRGIVSRLSGVMTGSSTS